MEAAATARAAGGRPMAAPVRLVRRRRDVVVHVAKPDNNARLIQRLDEEGKSLADINESDLGKPQFITTVIKPGVLGGGMWDPEPEDVRALPDKYEIPEPKPLDDGELWVREMKMKQKDEARARFAEEQANIGKNTLRPHSDIWSDVRINKRGEKLHWTDEEIEEFIGWYTFEPLQVRPLWQNYDYNMHLTPCVPETHVWMEEQGFRFYSEEDEMNLAEDSSLQTDFNDFDSMTTADVNAVDISDDDA